MVTKTQAGILVVAVRQQNTQGTAGSCDKYNRGLVLFRHTDGGDGQSFSVVLTCFTTVCGNIKQLTLRSWNGCA